MKVLILGGDGYLGWPTAMYLSAKGHDILAVDNYLRRNISRECNAGPLFEVPNLEERSTIWKETTGKEIVVRIGDLKDWSFVADVFRDYRPDVIVHYAEQPSAPYSMLNRRAATLTLENNLMVTANVIFAVREFVPEAHIVKLGTMGEYGTPDIDIEEGWLDIEHNGRKDTFLYPRQAGSLYHTTKIMDTDLLWFYVRTWGLKVTDLMQGPVYGFLTDECRHEERLQPFFSYDEIFGTVLNRFVVQAVAGMPLTVYGKGGQTRGYLNIKDTLQCILLALENPVARGELRILNQFTETFTVLELAEKVAHAGNAMGLAVEVANVENPRLEKESHYYNPAHTGLLELGLQPNYLSEEVLTEMLEQVVRHRDRIKKHCIVRGCKWS